MPYASIYRAKAIKITGNTLTAYVPQVFGDVEITVTDFLGAPAIGMGWVFFQGGDPEHPVWTSGLGGGGTVSDVVWVGPEAPEDEGIELWWDTDATTPLDPRYLTPTDAEALYLTSAEADALFLTQTEGDDRYPLGIIAYAQAVANQATITTVVDITGCSVTFTAVTGRYYKVTGSAYLGSTVIGDSMQMQITDAANVLKQQGEAGSDVVNRPVSIQRSWVTNSLSGSVTLKLRALRFSGTGTVTNFANATYPTFISVEDIGVL